MVLLHKRMATGILRFIQLGTGCFEAVPCQQETRPDIDGSIWKIFIMDNHTKPSGEIDVPSASILLLSSSNV